MQKLLIALLAITLSCFAGKLNIVTTTGTTQVDFTAISSMEIVTPTMILVNGGIFQMGDASINVAQPVHTVTLSSFYISKYEVTQADWIAIMDNNPSYFNDDLNCPVEQVSWYDIMVYCNKRSIAEDLTPCYTISGSTNPTNWGFVPTYYNSSWDAAICNWSANGYRLPTEAEWEFAARGGNNSQGYIYSGSNTIDNVAWYYYNSNIMTHPVGTKVPNELGLYNMSGNVWEWSWDWFGSYSSNPQTNPTGGISGSERIKRGGGSYDIEEGCRVAARDKFYPYGRYRFVGFRLARTY